MAFNNSVTADSHGEPSCIITIGEGVLAAWNLALAALLWTMMISAATFLLNMAAALILGFTTGLTDLCGNSLPSLGIYILLDVSEMVFYSTSRKDWSAILTHHKDWIREEIERILKEEEDLEKEGDDQYYLHRDQPEEIADWAVVPQAIVRDRVKRYRMILNIQKRITKIRLRRLLYWRAAGYFETLEERKRGQRIRSRDLWLAVWIYTYCISLWIFDMAFSFIWTAIGFSKSLLVLATEPWGVEFKLIITH
ncbi:hypothetical protein FMUND_657 [Fusarium mundagurra]|uniref:Uncharacterized protein n=1 Tax=Fusarium mundagurra TaxID=1567541 RepID=A0A8H5Z5M4_9HYPO|nr:hypothetical protein FMUND_657 [Fusarium mundagurra]